MDMRIGYANVYVRDLSRAVDFYHRVLGLPLLFRADQFSYARLAAGPIYIGLAAVDGNTENAAALIGRHTGVGFAVADIDATYAALSAKGVQFPMVPSDQPWGGRLALFADPDGNVFYLDRTVQDS
jgi:predicted enzyme related to lactoylglutathione lyase